MVGVGRGIGAACDVAAILGVRPVISRRDSFSAPAASAAAMATTRTRRGGWQQPQARTTTASTCISTAHRQLRHVHAVFVALVAGTSGPLVLWMQ